MKIKVINYHISSCEEKIFNSDTTVVNKYLIGRHPSCDLVLNTPEVSRIHGIIYICDRQYYFIDLASSDGSRVNNQPVEVNQSYPLEPDDVIHIGDFLLLIEDIDFIEDQPQSSDNFQLKKREKTGESAELITRCTRVIEETSDVKTFTFVAEPVVEFSYQPGQFVTLELEIDGKVIKRPYSISSTPSRPHSLDITIKRAVPPNDAPDAPPGLVSNWLHDNLQPGSQIKISKPLGDFSCVNHPSSKLLFISAGSGITPMMSMSRWLLDSNVGTDIVFFHSARTTSDIIFRQELELMASRYANFKLTVALTRQHFNSSPWGKIGRFSNSMLQAIAPDFKERNVYVCGSQSFTQEVKVILTDLNFPMQNYYQESFGKPHSKKKDYPTQIKATQNTVSRNEQTSTVSPEFSTNSTPTSATLVFANSGVEVVYDDTDTILEAAEKEGIELPYMCKMGACQKCKLRLLEGEVNYEEDPECQAGHVLTCIAQPKGRVVIEA
ncbi:MAG: FHA domain-containing protein [Cyanobacteria bacterium P01_A01_bin.45]